MLKPASYSQIFRFLLVSFIGFFSLTLFGNTEPLTVNDIIKKIESNLRSDSSQMDLTMTIETARYKRTIKCSIWSQGYDYSFIKIHYPKRDKGITFLKRQKEMWQYIPKVDRIIKIPPSMMMQSWMGSDFTNDDLVKESSFLNDYQARLVRETATNFIIELIPFDTAPVTWGKVILHVDKRYYIPIYQEFYDELDVLVRVMKMSQITNVDNKWYPLQWLILPQDNQKKGYKTIMTITSLKINVPLKESFFSLRTLKK